MAKKIKEPENITENTVIKEPEKVEFIEPKAEMKNEPLKEVENLLSGYQEKLEIEPENETLDTGDLNKRKRGRPKKSEETQEKSIPDSAVISGSLFILLIDLIIPNLICWLYNRFTKKRISPDKIMMTEAQRNELTPLADNVAKELAVSASPLTAFILALIGIYGINFMQLKK